MMARPFWRLRLPIFVVAAVAALAQPARATVRLPAFFTDNMVLQRDRDVPVWGWAEPEEEVSLDFAGQSLRTKGDAEGRWVMKLSPLTAANGGRELKIRGSNEIVLRNVVVGEVWICSGQSNMEWEVSGCRNLENEKKDAERYPLIRHLKIARAFSDLPLENPQCGVWTVCGPQTVGGFTAVGYFFARKLTQELNVPVGLISANWGGTRIEPWIAPEGFRSIRELKDTAAQLAKIDIGTPEGSRAYAEAVANIRQWLPAAEAAVAQNRYPAPLPQLPGLSGDHQQPARLFNAMVNPLIALPIRGVVWYQGESNGTEGDGYYHKMRGLIEGWRKLWNDEFSFYYVQLANFTQPNPNPAGGDEWTRLREAQTHSLNIPKTGMAVTIDIGEAGDIHPRNKQDVGLRLALWALAKDYGKSVVYSGPLYKSMTKEGRQIRLQFTETGTGLMIGAKDGLAPVKEIGGGKLKGFALADKSRKWVWAEAAIEGNTVVVSSPDIAEPEAVRYAFSKNPAGCNLYNREGLPASPFRTDRW